MALEFKSLKKVLTSYRFEIIFAVVLFLFSLSLRLYKIDGFMTFLGDEGRDVRVVRNILRGDPAFIGPQTSIGNMYLGPLYYYMMAPALLLSNLNPIGPAIMIALLGSLTTVMVYLIGREWFGKLAAGVAGVLYALSPVVIIYSRASWNPNPMPFFALLAIYGISQVFLHYRWKYLILSAFSLGAALQMHYLGLLLIPVLGIFTVIAFWQSNSQMRREALVNFGLSVVLFLAMMSPLFIFDLKHDQMNFNAFKAFFSDRQTTINVNPGRSDRFLPTLYKLTSDITLGMTTDYKEAISALFIALLILPFFTQKTKKTYLILAVWFGMGWLGLSLYKQHIYAHYFGFLYPVFYLIIGVVVATLYRKGVMGKIAGLFIFGYLAYLYIGNTPLTKTPNYQLQRTERAVDEIITQSGGQPFNFGLIAKQNYDESYRYFFENKGAQLVRGEEGITNQLFVICEDGDKCQPEGNAGWQIAIFGPAKTDMEWSVDYLRLYKLSHKVQK
jgi:4-amino-4-deoxy-L-arabinose transferase-like glycosyltransferase